MSDFEAEFTRRNTLQHVLSMALCLQDRSFPDMRRTAEELLIQRLPTLRPDDAGWINREEVRALLLALDPARPPLTVAILGALGQIGDRRAIPFVEALFGRIAQTNDPDETLVRDAAYDCLVRLREHAARARESSALLRGSQQPAGGQQAILLRAASATAAIAPTELLRPGDAPSDTLREEENDGPSF